MGVTFHSVPFKKQNSSFLEDVVPGESGSEDVSSDSFYKKLFNFNSPEPQSWVVKEGLNYLLVSCNLSVTQKSQEPGVALLSVYFM